MTTQSQPEIAPPHSLPTTQHALNRIKNVESAVALVALVRQIIAPFLLESFVFVSMRRGDPTRESYRYLIGSNPAWCQVYRARHWYSNDPFMEHALNESTMVLGSAIATASASQREMLATAAQPRVSVCSTSAAHCRPSRWKGRCGPGAR